MPPRSPNTLAGPYLERAAHLRKDEAHVQAALANPETLFVPVWQTRSSVLRQGDLVVAHFVTGAQAMGKGVARLHELLPDNELVPVLTSSVGLLVLLLYFPGGLVQIGYAARTAIVEWVERRHGTDTAKREFAIPKRAATVREALPEGTPALRASEVTVRFGGIALTEVNAPGLAVQFVNDGDLLGPLDDLHGVTPAAEHCRGEARTQAHATGRIARRGDERDMRIVTSPGLRAQRQGRASRVRHGAARAVGTGPDAGEIGR